MKPSDLVYVGIAGCVVALDRASGEIVWKTHLKGGEFVNVLLDQGQLFATTRGEIFCLDPLTGDGRWHNRLKGLGTGLATLATVNSFQAGVSAILSEKRRRDEEAAAAASSGATTG
jgi:outer membrane protein assembly factor BamB